MNKKLASFFLIVFFGINHLFGNSHKPARLAAYDAIAIPGLGTILTAKVEKKMPVFNPDISGETISFYINGEKIGESVSNKDGMAILRHTFNRTGKFELEVMVSTGSRYHSDPALSKIFCSDRQKPAIVVDIDHTVADVSLAMYILKSNKKVMPLKNAPDILNKLSREYDIVFVTNREELFLRKTNDWLQMYKFPAAPVFFRNMGNYPFDPAKYKSGRIKELKKCWSNISIGIGDRKTDLQAYRANDMKSIIIGKGTDVSGDVIYVRGWEKIEKLLLKIPDK